MALSYDIRDVLSPSSDWAFSDGRELSTRFLNHGSFGATPISVLQQQAKIKAKIEQYPDRFYDGDLAELWREQRDHLADFVGANRSDLVLTPNATFGTSSVLHSLDWQPGDEVVCIDHAYASVNAYLELLKHRGVQLRVVKLSDPYPGHQELLKKIEKELSRRTKLIVIDHLTSPSAMVMPVREVTTLARQHGCQVFIDGAHAPGQLQLDLRSWQPDFYVGNCHKWLFSPRSASFLYVAKSDQSSIRPPIVGNFYHDSFASAFSWIGTLDQTGLLCVRDGIDFWKSLGGARLQERNHQLAKYAQDKMLDALGQSSHMPQSADYLGSMAAMPIRACDNVSRSEAQHWRQHFRDRFGCAVNFSVIGKQLWVRICAQAYNCAEDYDFFAEALSETFVKSENL